MPEPWVGAPPSLALLIKQACQPIQTGPWGSDLKEHVKEAEEDREEGKEKVGKEMGRQDKESCGIQRGLSEVKEDVCCWSMTEKKRKQEWRAIYFPQIASLEDLSPKGHGLPLPLGNPYMSKPGPHPTGIRRGYVGSST